MKIDAHQHFWDVARGDYGWLTPDLGEIYRNFGPGDLKPILRRQGIDATILVQAAPTAAETRFLLDVARETPFVAGVVGWLDFDAPDAKSQLLRMATDPLLVGLRPMMQGLPDDDWMLNPAHAYIFAAMIEASLVFDALVFPRHLSRLLVLIDRHPDLAVVVDHCAKPAIAGRALDPWRADMAAIAARPNVNCKLSGLVTEASADWQTSDLVPFAEHVLQVFGPERLIWGSDWPVLNRKGGYDRWQACTEELLIGCSAVARAAVLGGNAQRVYLSKRGRG